MNESGEIIDLRLRPRETTTVSLAIPSDTLVVLREVALRRDMSPEALMRLYIGQGLREDEARSPI